MSGTTAGSTDPGDRSAAEIEREVEATRANLTGTLEELRDRASPGQLFEQAIDYARSSGGAEFVGNLGQAVRDNPLPLLLIGAGIGWLMLSGNSGGGGQRAAGTSTGRPLALPPPSAGTGGGARYRAYGGEDTARGGPSLTERASGMAGDAARRAGEAAGGLRDSAAGAASQAADMAGSAYRGAADAAGAAADRAGSAYRSVADAASDAADGVGSAASSAARYLSKAGQDAREYVSDLGRGARGYTEDLGESARYGAGWLMREQPLVLGAIGVALGAAVGALLPGTEAEDRLMGETRDSVAAQAQALAQDGYERVKDAAGEHLENARAAVGEAAGQAKGRLDQGGVSAERAGDAVGEAARGLREAVRGVVQDVAGEAKAALGSGDGGGAGPSGSGGAPQPRQEGGTVSGPSPSPERPGPV